MSGKWRSFFPVLKVLTNFTTSNKTNIEGSWYRGKIQTDEQNLFNGIWSGIAVDVAQTKSIYS